MNSRILGVTALALGACFGGISTHVPPSRPYRRHYSSAYTDGAVCQYPTGFPIQLKGKPRSNKNRNYRKARKARKLKEHFLNSGSASRKIRQGIYSWGQQ